MTTTSDAAGGTGTGTGTGLGGGKIKSTKKRGRSRPRPKPKQIAPEEDVSGREEGSAAGGVGPDGSSAALAAGKGDAGRITGEDGEGESNPRGRGRDGERGRSRSREGGRRKRRVKGAGALSPHRPVPPARSGGEVEEGDG